MFYNKIKRIEKRQRSKERKKKRKAILLSTCINLKKFFKICFMFYSKIKRIEKRRKKKRKNIYFVFLYGLNIFIKICF